MKRAFSFFFVSTTVGLLSVGACGSTDDTTSGGAGSGGTKTSSAQGGSSSPSVGGTTSANGGTTSTNGNGGMSSVTGGHTAAGGNGGAPASYVCATVNIQPTTAAEAHGTDGCCNGSNLYNQGSNNQLVVKSCGSSTSCGWDAAQSKYACGTDGAAGPAGKPKACGNTAPVDCATCSLPELEAKAKPSDAACIQCAKESCCDYVAKCKADATCNDCLNKFLSGQNPSAACIQNNQIVRAYGCLKDNCPSVCPTPF